MLGEKRRRNERDVRPSAKRPRNASSTTCDIPKPKVDLKLLAHVLNDPDLTGSQLQGGTFQITIAHAYHFFKRFLNGELQLLGMDKATAKDLMAFLEPIEKMCLKTNEILFTADKETLETHLKDCANIMFEELTNTGHICVEGGWAGQGKSGHGMLYEFFKDEDEDGDGDKNKDKDKDEDEDEDKNKDIIMLVWNTGCGLENHLWEETIHGKLYSPAKAFRIPALKEKYFKPFKDYLHYIVEPCYLAKWDTTKAYDSDYIYKTIIPNISFVKGVEIDPAPYIKRKVQSQFSGTCAWQVLNELIVNQDFAVLDIDEVHYEMMRDTLAQFCKELTPNEWQQEDVISQLNFATKNFSVAMKKIETNKHFSQERLTQGAQLIDNIKAQLAPKIDTPSMMSRIYSSTLNLLKWPFGSSEQLKSKPFSRQPIWPAIDISKNNSVDITRFSNFRKTVDLSKKNFNEANNIINSELGHESQTRAEKINNLIYIENLLLTLPIKEDFYIKQPKDALVSFMKSLESLCYQYCSLCKHIDGFSFGERIIAIKSAIGACATMSIIIFKDKPDIYQNIFQKIIYYLNKQFIENKSYGFFTLSTTLASNRETELTEFYQQRITLTNSDNTLHPIQIIANEHSEFRNKAIQEGVKLDTPAPKIEIPGLYYVINDKKSPGNLEKEFPLLANDIECYFTFSALTKLNNDILLGDNLVNMEQPTNPKLSYVSVDDDNEIYFRPEFSNPTKRNTHKRNESFLFKNNFSKDDLGNTKVENDIQIEFKNHTSAKTDLRNYLKHARACANSQIVSALELFKSNFNQLNDPDFQNTLFVILLNDALLLNEIRNNKEAIDSLITILENALSCYESRENSQSVLQFLLKTTTFVNQQQIGCLVNQKTCKHINSQIEKTDHIIEKLCLLLGNDNAAPFRIIHLSNRHRMNKSLSMIEWTNLFTANYLFNTSDQTKLDPFLVKEIQYAMDYIKSEATAKNQFDSNEITKMVERNLPSNYLESPHHFDLLNGILEIEGNAICTIPEEIEKHLLFKRLFPDADKNAIKINSSCFEFLYQNEKYRAIVSIKHSKTKLKIQKEISVGDTTKWYQLSENFTETNHIKEIPYTLIDSTKYIWQNQRSFVITDVKTHKKCFYYDEESMTLRKFNAEGHFQCNLISIPTELSILKNFEHCHFIESWHDLTTNEILIKLPRYGIELRQAAQDRGGKWIFKNHKTICDLVLETPTLIKHFNHVLVLSPNGNINPDQYLYAIPDQSLLPNKSNFEADFYATKLDIKLIEKIGAHIRKNESISSPNITSEIKKLQQCPTVHYFKNQESFLLFTKNRNGELVGKTTKEKLKLAYFYFGKKEPAKAFNLLSDCQNVLSGSLEELTILHDIIDNAPSKIADLEQQEKVANLGPEYTAVRTLACYLVASYLNTGKYNGKLRKKEGINGFINTDAHAYHVERLELFLSKITLKIENILDRYFSMNDFISKSLRLKNNQLDALINMLSNKDYYAKHYQKQKRFEKASEQLVNKQALVPTKTKISNKEEIYTLSDTRAVQGYKDQRYPTVLAKKDSIKISDLSMRTEMEVVDANFMSLCKEAAESSANLKALRKYTNYKLDSLLPRWNHCLTKEPTLICTPFFLQALLDKDIKIDFFDGYNVAKNKFKPLSPKIETIKVTHAIAEHPEKIVPFFQKKSNKNINNRTAPVISKFCRSIEEILQSLNLSHLYKDNFEIDSMDCDEAIFNTNEAHCPFISDAITEANRDYQIGKKFNLNRQEKVEFFKGILNNEKTLKKLLSQIDSELTASETKFNDLENQIIKLVNQGPEEEKAHLTWETSLNSQAIKRLGLHESLQLFSKYSYDEIRRKRCLSEKNVHELYSMAMTYLAEGTKRQQLTRSRTLLNKLDGTDACYFDLGKALTQKRCYNIQSNYDLILFEFLDNKLIYPEQYNINRGFLEIENNRYPSKTVQQIPGSGKSKLTLPVLAQCRADGTHLVIVEVPTGLFETNLQDLEEISLRVFGKRPMSFTFHRQMVCDSHYFKQLLTDFKHVISNKSYVLTTKTSIDSLSLKYIEILNQPLGNLAEWKKQIHYLDRIINLLKNKGNVISDEIDTNLNSKDHLIYTIHPGNPIDSAILQSLIDMYGFFKAQIPNLYLILTKQAPLPSHEDQKSLLNKAALQLTNSPKSPLGTILKKLNEPDQKKIKLFLDGADEKLPKALTTIDKEILAVYKEELNHLLKIVFNKDYNVHYGLPLDKSKDQTEQLIAIPYLANNVPNESSKFQNALLTNTYTISIHLKEALYTYPCKQFVAHFKQLHQKEIEKKLYNLSSSNQYADMFYNLTQYRKPLENIEPENKTHMLDFYNHVKDNFEVKKYCLQEFILPSVLTNAVTLSANAQNHVSLFQSYSGFTGTDYNWRTFHDSISRDNSTTEGTDGRTLHLLIQNERATHIFDEKNPDKLFDLLTCHPDKKRLRAIIDTGSLFSGIHNISVAERWAALLSENNYNEIRYVLFFDNDNQLSALSVTKDLQERKVTKLGSTENIAMNLGCKLEEYVTYYDQFHTTGIDIKQASDTIGLITHDFAYNILRDDIQGANRLRDLTGNQRIEFILLNAKLNIDSKRKPDHWDVSRIFNAAFYAQIRFLMNEHLNAGYQKIHNTFRADLVNYIRLEKSITKKCNLGINFNPYFYTKANLPFLINMENQSHYVIPKYF